MKSLTGVIASLAVITILAPQARAITQEEIRQAIESGVDQLIVRQAEDGHWPYSPVVQNGVTSDEYALGATALVVLALQHSTLPKAQPAIQKGLSFILQHPPETVTYTSGLIPQVLYKADPEKFRDMIGAYAWMLAKSQKTEGPQLGSWTYNLVEFPKVADQRRLRQNPTPPAGRSDNSNSQFAILGLAYAQKAGYQIPIEVWLRARDYYMGAQHQDGGWDYLSDAYRRAFPSPQDEPNPAATPSMTLAGTVSIYLMEEMLADKSHRQCTPPPISKSHEAGLKWIADNWTTGLAPYGWYACERLGILTGYSEFGGHDWYEEGAIRLASGKAPATWHGQTADLAFTVLFLSRGLEPVIINKLKRTGDWNNHRYDIAHLTEYLSSKFQYGKQWRIVTLDASVDMLLKVPILWISGHEALQFADGDKQKLKEYVDRGGTILAEACCSKRAFDKSFRALTAELWPDGQLLALPKSHPIYVNPRPLRSRPALEGLALTQGEGRLGVIYIPYGISCRWETGGPKATADFDLGANIYFYVDKIGRGLSRGEPVQPRQEPPPEPDEMGDPPDESGGAEE